MSGVLPPSEFSEDDILKCAICSGELVDAVLLSCLHSACRSCTVGDVSTSVTCPTCEVTTDTPTWKTNLLVSSLANRAIVLKDVFTCTQCIDHENQDATAVAWCYTCQHSLCVSCQKSERRLHSTHRVMHLNECTNLSELYRPLAPPCTKHNEESKLACFTCKVGRCYKCAHDCYTSSHDILPLDCPDAIKRMNDIALHITNVLSKLNATQPFLHAHLALPENVLRAREESLVTLKKSKKTAIESINNAYEKATESLLDCWDSLAVKSLSKREGAERLKTRISWTNKYCQLALNSGDIVGLLSQLDDVLSSLHTCLKEASHFKEPVDPSELVTLNMWLPSDLDLIASSWFGSAIVVSEDFNCSPKDYHTDEKMGYYKRKVLTLKELEQFLKNQKEVQEIIQVERQAMARPQSEAVVKDEQLVATQNEVKKLLDQQKEQQQQLERERMTVVQPQSELLSKTQQLVAKQSEVNKLLDEQDELRYQLDREQRRVLILQSDLRSQAQQLVEQTSEIAEQKEKLKQLEQMRRKVEQLQSELEFATREKPLSFVNIRHASGYGCIRDRLQGPGSCWDVAVTPQGSLLVAAMADGLKEYGATSFREIATWIPDAELLGPNSRCYVTTVDVLSDGRALVGLNPNLIVLLRREAVSSSSGCSSSAAEAWCVERLVAELQAPSRALSAWGDSLLAVLEDRYDKNTNICLPGPSLVLLSLSDDEKQLHRQQLDYDAGSVALTDGKVIVQSTNELELSEAVGSWRGNRKCYVVDCYSHFGVRLWRHEVANGAKIMSVCLDSVGRVIYAAECRGPVVALSVDDGRRLSTAVELSGTETETSYAIAFDKATQSRLALISRVGQDEPNIIDVFCGLAM